MYQYEADFLVPLQHRAAEPLFTDDSGRRLIRQWLEKVLKAWLQLANVDHKTHSWHSFRVYLACALKSANADGSGIKAMVKWVSDASLKIYARVGKHIYAVWLRKAQLADVTSVYLHSLPEYDDDAHVARLKEILDNNALEPN